jgi:hypothetical protein
LKRRDLLGDACGIHQDVNLAEFLKNLAVQAFERSAIEHIAGDAQSASAEGFNFCGDCFHLFRPARTWHHVAPRAGHAERDFAAKASGSTDDDGDSAREIEEALTHDVFLPQAAALGHKFWARSIGGLLPPRQYKAKRCARWDAHTDRVRLNALNYLWL